MPVAHVIWKGPEFLGEVTEIARKRITAAAIYLANVIKADISQPGTLVYSPIKNGKFRKTVYNFTHSYPGHPPYLQTGRLRSSISWEVVSGGVSGKLYGRVGSNVVYAKFLESGTRKMLPRPFIVINTIKHRTELAAIMTGKGGVPPIVPNQYRSGYLGAGARRLGYL